MDPGNDDRNGQSSSANKSQLRRAHAQREEEEMLAKRQKTRNDRREIGPLYNPTTIQNPLIVYPSLPGSLKPNEVKVVMDPRLSDALQTHQRKGVSKMYQVLSKYCNPSKRRGFILADGMGLGKTVQTITVLWTLLKQSPEWDEATNNRKTEIKKAIIVCPKGVIHVWDDQLKKWLEPTGEYNATNASIHTEILDERKNIDKKRAATLNFMDPSNKTQVLILSYETFVFLCKDYNGPNDQLLPGPLYENIGNVVDLLIMDEAHYIKNPETKRCGAIFNFKVSRKIALTGTPLQNNLREYYTLLDYIQPDILGNENDFKWNYEQPIMQWVENKSQLQGKEALDDLKRIVHPFFLRRTTNMFVKANKTEYIVCCRMHETGGDGSDTQLQLYNKFVEIYKSAVGIPKVKGTKKAPQLNGFQAIGFLKDLCSHPALVYKKCLEYKKKGIIGAEQLLTFFDPGHINVDEMDYTLSAKLRVLNSLLLSIKKNEERNDRVVIVSYYTETLKGIEKYLEEKKGDGFYFVRYDGSTAGNKRKKIIDEFNDPCSKNQFIMTLSSRAGGVGISLIGANHLIMFDPDWNPANDEQAMCRIYREGQRKDCHIYRFVTTSSIEENIFHRQIVKKLLAGAVLNEDEDDSNIFNYDSTPLQQQQQGKLGIDYCEEMLDQEQIASLFGKINPGDSAVGLTHTQLDCKRCDVTDRKELTAPIVPTVEHSDSLQLQYWNHHFSPDSLPEECEAIQDAWAQAHFISCVFRKRSAGIEKKSSRPVSNENDLLNMNEVSISDSL